MCLFDKDNFKIHKYTGYQVVDKLGDVIYSGISQNEPYFINKWYKALKINLFFGDSNECYTSGFHIFKTLKDAIMYKNYLKLYLSNTEFKNIKIVKVRFKKVTCKGIQKMGFNFLDYSKIFGKVIVAQERKILNEVKIKDI